MRARNIKPAFFKNEHLATLPFEARLLFVGLWCMADRSGRLEFRSVRIKAELYPYDNVDVTSLCRELSAKGFISIYPKRSQKYLQINNFTKHQYPHIKESKSTIPAPDSNRTSTVRKRLNPLSESVDLELNPRTESVDLVAGSSKSTSSLTLLKSTAEHTKTCTCEICWKAAGR